MGLAFVPIWRDRLLASDRVDDLAGPARGVHLQLMLHADRATGRLAGVTGDPWSIERIRTKLRYGGREARAFARAWDQLVAARCILRDPVDGAFVVFGFAERCAEALRPKGETIQAAHPSSARPLQAAEHIQKPTSTAVRIAGEAAHPDAEGQLLLLPGGGRFSTSDPPAAPSCAGSARDARANGTASAPITRTNGPPYARARVQPKPSERREPPPKPPRGGRVGGSHEPQVGSNRRKRRRLPRITSAQLERDELTGALAGELQELGFAPPGERGEQLVFVQAEHARMVGQNPPALFAGNVRGDRWDRGSEEAERRGLHRWKLWTGRLEGSAA